MMLPLVYQTVGYAGQLMPDGMRAALSRYATAPSPLGQALDASAPLGPVRVRVAGGPLRGARLSLDLAAEREYWLGTYERPLARAIRRLCRPGAVAYDIGAHVGYTALTCALRVGRGGSVYAFEPLPDNLRRLRAHILMNPAGAAVRIVAAAASDREGVEALLVHRSGALGALAGSDIPAWGVTGCLPVAAVRLDDFVFRGGNPAPDLIKVDVEGGAAAALRGCEQILCDLRPALLLELHGPDERQGCWDVLRRCRYAWRALGEGWRHHVVALPE